MSLKNGNDYEVDNVEDEHEDWSEPPEPPRRRLNKIQLFIILFIIAENIIIPPRYQVSNNIALGGIWLWQHTASPAFRETGIVRCRFYPSCSEYSRLGYLHYGFLSGFGRSIWRILRCNPWNRDPHEDWPYEGAWEDCRQLPPSYLGLPDDVHLPPTVRENR